MVTAIVFILILMTAVLVHELAHYWNARSVGLPVRAFSIGMGPVLWRKQWRGTEWRLALLPIGGYVDIPGMAPQQDEEGNLQHPTDGFAQKRWHEKIWVLVGGVIANYILAVILLATVISLDPSYRSLTSNIPTEVSGARIAGVVSGMPAETLGLKADDSIVSINGIPDPDPNEVTQSIQTTQGTLELKVKRNGETLDYSLPWPPAELGEGEKPLLGIQIAPLEVSLPPETNFFAALGEAASFSVRIIPEAVRGFARGFGAIVTGRQSQDVAGPVGIVTAVNQAAQIGVIPVLALAALINISLAIFNLLPIPGLDGGRMLLATITALRGKPFKPGQEEFIHFLGIMAVLAFMVLVTFNELSGLFFKG